MTERAQSRGVPTADPWATSTQPRPSSRLRPTRSHTSPVPQDFHLTSVRTDKVWPPPCRHPANTQAPLRCAATSPMRGHLQRASIFQRGHPANARPPCQRAATPPTRRYPANMRATPANMRATLQHAISLQRARTPPPRTHPSNARTPTRRRPNHGAPETPRRALCKWRRFDLPVPTSVSLAVSFASSHLRPTKNLVTNCASSGAATGWAFYRRAVEC